jgi:hypothetical protein
MSEDKETTGDREYQGFEVLQSRIASPPNIVWREETEDVFGGFRKLPELVDAKLVDEVDAGRG